MKAKRQPQPVKTYSALAQIYDYVMAHVNYKMWARYITAIFRLASRKVQVIADLSCGTANLLPHLKSFQHQVYGLDLSLAMLKVARQKNPQQPLICADFKHLPLQSSRVDVALALYDSVNYLMHEDDVLQFFSECYRILRPGGLLVFDVVTPFLCRTAFKEYHESANITENLSYDRYSFFKLDQSLQINRFKIQMAEQYFFEEHRQKIREIKEWIQLIKQSDFKLLEIFSNFSMKPVQETSERAHFVLKR